MAKHCSPNKEHRSISCFSKDSLQKIAKVLNERNSGGGGRRINLSTNKANLWQQIKERMSYKCNSESCWIEQDFIKNIGDPELTEESFRPKMPKEWKNNPNEWLSTTDINSVMNQYEKQYPDFLYLGAVPSDCPNGIICELSNIKLNHLAKDGQNRVGIIYNLDPHYKNGSHWVAAYINVSKNLVWYYDSNGLPPIKPIRSFLSQMEKQLSYINNSKPYYAYNKRRHQYGNNECGMYSMYFLVNCLKGKTISQISRMNIPDKTMNILRRLWFR